MKRIVSQVASKNGKAAPLSGRFSWQLVSTHALVYNCHNFHSVLVTYKSFTSSQWILRCSTGLRSNDKRLKQM